MYLTKANYSRELADYIIYVVSRFAQEISSFANSYNVIPD